MFEGFSEASKKVLRAAQDEARRSGHGSFGPEHILLALLRERHGASTLLQLKGLNLRDTRWEVEKLLGRSSAPVPHDIPFNGRASAVMRTAIEVTGPNGEAEPQHLLLGLLREQEGPLIHLLENLGADVGELHAEAMGLVEHMQTKQAATAAAASSPVETPGRIMPEAQGWAALPREERQVTHYRWSPDGRRLIMETIRGLWVVQRAAPEHQIFLGEGQFPAWSPDGRMLVFFRNRELALWDGPANRIQTIDDQATWRFEQPWSPDGGYVAFIKLNNLVLWDAETHRIKVLTSLTGTHLAQFEWLPPSGEMITFLNNNMPWLVPLDGSGARPFLP